MKVCFLSWHYGTPQLFLDTLTKMTPQCSNRWKDMEAVTDPDKADFICVFDGYSASKLPLDRTLYFGQHPKIENGHCPAFRTWAEIDCLGKYPLDKHWNCGEWWIPQNYDELTKMKYKDVKKDKKLCCIMTYQNHKPMYAQRLIFMEKFSATVKDYDLYGRPSEKFLENGILSEAYKGQLGPKEFDAKKGEHFLGKEIVGQYDYSLEFDVGPTKNYISERFYDALLLWTFPFYFGSTNVEEILPEGSFANLDIQDTSFENTIATRFIAENKPSKSTIEKMAEARDLLLNKYQTWARVYETIKEL